VRFKVGELLNTQIEVYPQAHHVDIRARHLLVGLNHVDFVSIDQYGLTLQSRDFEQVISAQIQSDGSVTLILHSPPTLEDALSKDSNLGRAAAALPTSPVGETPPPTPLQQDPEPSGSVASAPFPGSPEIASGSTPP